MGRVRLCHREIGQADLFEAIVVHRPKDIAPSRVQRAYVAAVPCFQPPHERCAGCIGIADRGVVAAIFVVGLPGGDPIARSIAFRHKGDDAPGLLAVAPMAETIVAAGSKSPGFAVLIKRKHIRMPVYHPARRRCGWCAKHHFQPC